ncbi:AbrB family transcriptional regulator [Tyzzerella sp. OttesenSCG-928-J15]|nr:AbrB family transcriptional regulator [Tyzzerella sp. OttesenSCG-928-J15]
MENILKLAVTIGVGVIGGITAKKMKFVPAAFMLGALILVAAYNLTTGYAYFPYVFRIVTQILSGTYLGLSINKESLYSIRTLLKPVTLIMVLFFCVTLIFGFAIHFIFGVDIVTSLYCFAPGGVSDIGIIADSVGGDVAMITFMQLVRLITVFLFYPFLYQFMAKKGIIHTNMKDDGESEKAKAKKNIKDLDIDMTKEEKVKGLLVALPFAAVGGIVGYFSGIPAGAMVFAMVFAVIINVTYKKTYMPIQMRYFAQILSGVYLALRITHESLAQLSQSVGPVLVMILSVTTTPLIIGYIVHKLTKMDLGTSLFCCTPGGMSEMTLLADDMGLDIVKVSITHLARVIIVISIFPQLINLILRFMV